MASGRLDERALEAVGLSEFEERIYRLLVERPTSSLAEIVDATAIAQPQARNALASLHARGLVTHGPGRPRRYLPAPPDIAVEVLILRRQEELERTRLAASQLADTLRRTQERGGRAELVEVVSGREAYAQRYLQLERSAAHELLSLDQPPYLTAAQDCAAATNEGLRSGVRYRSIYAREALELPGQSDALRETIAQGERVRVLPRLPLKLAIADGRLGFIPLDLEPGHESAVLIHRSALLDALIHLFELLWERALPIRFPGDHADTSVEEEAAFSAPDETLLMLLVAGLRDKAIARQLGVGVSTIERRISRLLTTLGTETRFQAGWKAALAYGELTATDGGATARSEAGRGS